MYSFKSKIRYSEVDADCRLTWLALIDYFQDCSVFHSEAKDVGVQYLFDNDMAWVISYWHIKIDELPVLSQNVETWTWPYEMKGFYGWRNFRMTDETGRRLAYANSIWVLMDTKKGRPVKIPKRLEEAYPCEKETDMDYAGRKVNIPEEYIEMEHFIVPSYFIDSNQHMNNSRYVSTALCFVPEGFNIKELKVEYRKSARLGDEVIPRVTIKENSVTVALCSNEGVTYAAVQFLN